MAFTPEELKIAEKVKEQWGTREDFAEIIVEFRKRQQSAPSVEKVKEPIVETTPKLESTEKTVVAWGWELQDIGKTLWTLSKITPLQWITETLATGAEKFISGPLTSLWQKGKEAWESFKTEATGQEGIKEGAKNLIKNIIPSLTVQWWELIDTVANPIDTTSWLLNLWQWITDKLVFGILDTVTGQDKRTVSAQTEIVDSVTKQIVEKYGTPTKFWKEVQQNPALLLEIWFSAVKKWWRIKLSESDKLKIAELEKQAEWQVKEFLKPTKNITKDISKKITPDLIDRIKKWEIKPGDREQILDIANSKVSEFWEEIGNFIKEWKVKWEIDFDGMIDILAKEDAKLRIDWEILPWNELAVNFINKQLDFLGNLQTKYGKNIPAEKQVELRRLYDVVFDKGITRDKISKFQDDLQIKLADDLRKELAKNNPQLDELNKNFTFYKGLQNVLDETVTRTQWHDPVWLISELRKQSQGTAGAIIWWALWSPTWPIWTVVWATIWWAIWAKLTRVTSSPKFKLLSAKKKSEIADSIARWDAGKLEKLLDSIIISEGVKDFNEQQLPSTREIIS